MSILGSYFNHSLIKITSKGLTINPLHGNKTYCNAPVVAGFYRLLLTVSRIGQSGCGTRNDSIR